jgi:cytochrome P450
MPDQPYPPIQARELMNPLPEYTRLEWQDMPRSERERLIRESRAQFQTENRRGPSGAQPGGQAVGVNQASPDFLPKTETGKS